MNTIADDNLIFHYCSTQSALSILKSNEIWMTNIRNMNDGNETIGVYKIFFDLLKKYDKMNSLDAMCKFADTPGSIQLYETCLGAYSEHVVCFSKDPDSVSQWISYADDGYGLAIGFDEDRITNITSANNTLSYQRITYVDEEMIKKYIPNMYEDLIEHLSGNALEMMDRAMVLLKSIFPLGIACKTWHYSAEKETRLIYQYNDKSNELSNGWEIKECHTFAKRNLINTYIPLAFPKDIIRKIVFGPKFQNNFFETESALYRLGYTNAIFEKSTSGYR